MAAYTAALEDEMKSEYEEFYELQYYEDIWNKAVDNATVIRDFPPEYLQKKTERSIISARKYAQSLNMTFEDFVNEKMGLTVEEFNSQAIEYAKVAAKESMVLAAIAKAEDITVSDEDIEKAIVYVSRNKNERGYYFKGRQFDYQKIRLLAESIYSSKYLSQSEAENMADVLRAFVSNYQADSIKSSAFVTDRVRTSNSDIVFSLDKIDEAMAKKLEGEKHEPEKITFTYYSYSISNLKQEPRRQGNKYKVSPYKVIVADGNYYLLAYDDNKKDIRIFRIDRMKGVNRTGEPREGKEVFEAIDLKNFTKRRFGMFGGRQASIRIRCINPLLDAMVERFGTQYATYTKPTDDPSHFILSTTVEVSDQFFGWLLGFGNKVKLLGDAETVADFKEYLDKVKVLY